MKRPVGMITLGILCIFAGVSGFSTSLHKPVLFFGMRHTGMQAFLLHLIPGLGGIYIGIGLLIPFRHVWYLYLAGAGISMMGLLVNLMHPAKIWEFYIVLATRTASVPNLVKFTIVTHYLFIAMYALTALYVYAHKQYFWGIEDL